MNNYTWEDVRDIANQVYVHIYPSYSGNICSKIYDNNLPKMLKDLAVAIFAYEYETHTLIPLSASNIALIRLALRQLDSEGCIGYPVNKKV